MENKGIMLHAEIKPIPNKEPTFEKRGVDGSNIVKRTIRYSVPFVRDLFSKKILAAEDHFGNVREYREKKNTKFTFDILNGAINISINGEVLNREIYSYNLFGDKRRLKWLEIYKDVFTHFRISSIHFLDDRIDDLYLSEGIESVQIVRNFNSDIKRVHIPYSLRFLNVNNRTKIVDLDEKLNNGNLEFVHMFEG